MAKRQTSHVSITGSRRSTVMISASVSGCDGASQVNASADDSCLSAHPHSSQELGDSGLVRFLSGALIKCRIAVPKSVTHSTAHASLLNTHTWPTAHWMSLMFSPHTA